MHGPIHGLGSVKYDCSASTNVDAALSVPTGSSPLHTASMSVCILHRHHNNRLIRQYESKRFVRLSPRDSSVLFFSGPQSEGGHTMDVLSPFISVLCHSD